MSYVKQTDFAVKDTLLVGDPAKIVKGAEFDAEFEAIEDALLAIENGSVTINDGTF